MVGLYHSKVWYSIVQCIKNACIVYGVYGIKYLVTPDAWVGGLNRKRHFYGLRDELGMDVAPSKFETLSYY